MTTIQKTDNGSLILKKDNYIIKTMFDMGKLWLTKKEIAKIYGIKKSEIKKELKYIILNSNVDLHNSIKKIYNDKKDKIETYYNLDILLILGYKSKHFHETKYLINKNKIFKEYTAAREYRKINRNSILGKILNYLSN